MLNLLSKKIVKRLIKNNVIKKNQTDIYIYGFSLIISNFIGFFTVLTLSLILKSISAGLIFLLIIITLRANTGGYHAKSYFLCNLILNLSFLICFYFSKINLKYTFISFFLQIFIIIFSIIIIIKFIPIENKNKRILKKRKVYKIKSIILYLTYYTNGIYLYLHDLYLGKFILTTLNFTIIILLFELIRRRFIYE